MKKLSKNIKWIYLLILSFFLIVACSKMDDYKKFVEGGEISYAGKIDSVKVYAGDGRVYFQGLFMSDPKVAGCIIYWNSLEDSLEIPITKTAGIDTLKQFIQLPENLYNFQIYTFDALGNRSVPVYAVGRSYGDAFKQSISNRLIISAIPDQKNQVKIVWRDMDRTLGPIGTEVEYTDQNNKKQLVYTSLEKDTTLLPNFKLGTDFSYKTLYLPDTLCIDTFRTVAQDYKHSSKIDKSGWVASADTYEHTAQLPKGCSPDFVIDDDPTTFWHTAHSAGTTPFPHWLVFDMKKEIQVDFIELTSRSDYLTADFKDFLVEGRNSTTAEWVTYGSFTLLDIAGAQQFLLSGSPSMRYIRIYQINGGGEPHSHLAEFSVYGNEIN